MNQIPPQPYFLKLKLSDKTLLGFIASDRPTRQDLGFAGSVPTSLRYIFKRYYKTDFSPTLMGDALLVHSHQLDLHLKPADVDKLADLFMKHGFRLGQFHEDWKDIIRIRHEFKRAHYYAPREELLGIKGEAIEMPSNQLVLTTERALL